MRGRRIDAEAAIRRLPDAVQIVALPTDPMWQRSGVGGYLVAEVELMARTLGVARALLPHLTPAFVCDFAGIPVRDEIRLEETL